ncbi:MAG TPA: hypothetical protein VK989_16030 [Polyangia bacterium]|jgi:hypothetical protein|nr:hypothetical protein [Polyangia bacterium]
MSVHKQTSLSDLLKPAKPREYRTASVQLLWPPSVKILVQQLSGKLGTSMNDLVLRSLQTALAGLPPDAASDDIRNLVESLLRALEQLLPSASDDVQGRSAQEEDHHHAA